LGFRVSGVEGRASKGREGEEAVRELREAVHVCLPAAPPKWNQIAVFNFLDFD
jgi:hypothetical protein